MVGDIKAVAESVNVRKRGHSARPHGFATPVA